MVVDIVITTEHFISLCLQCFDSKYYYKWQNFGFVENPMPVLQKAMCF